MTTDSYLQLSSGHRPFLDTTANLATRKYIKPLEIKCYGQWHSLCFKSLSKLVFANPLLSHLHMQNKFRQLGFFRLTAIAAVMAAASPLAGAGVVTTLTAAKGSYALGGAQQPL